MKKLVVFASGSGSNFQSIIDAILSGQLNARIVGLMSNKEDAYCIRRASKNDIPTVVLKASDYTSEFEYEQKLLDQLRIWEADVIVLAGYLRKIPVSIIDAFPNNILNIHPSLLPKYGGKGYYGIKVHKAVLAANEEESGCTIHIVSREYDEGPILGQSRVPVFKTDTPEQLADRVLIQEHKLYPAIIQQHLESLKN